MERKVHGGQERAHHAGGSDRRAGCADAASPGPAFGRYAWLAAQATREAGDWWDAAGYDQTRTGFVRAAEKVERDFPYSPAGEGERGG